MFHMWYLLQIWNFFILNANMNERFLRYLRFKKLSQKKLCELSSVPQATVSRFCNGNGIMSDALLKMLQVCDDLSLEWFFYGTGERCQ